MMRTNSGVELVNARRHDLLAGRAAGDDGGRLGPGAHLDGLLDEAAVRFIDEPHRQLA